MQRLSTLREVFFSSLTSVLVLLLVQANLFSQETTTPSKTADSKSTDNPATGKKEVPAADKGASENLLPRTRVRQLPNKNGEIIDIPRGHTWEEFEKWFEESRNRPSGPKAATISQIDIVGDADEDRANLKVTFTIQVHQSDQFESVPLFFNEAVLMSMPVYTGKKDFQQFSHDKDRVNGYVWWLRGRGEHRLEFQFRVQLRKSLPSRHLAVTLPTSPISRVKLTVPYASVNAKVLPEQAVVEVNPTGSGTTTIEAFGLGSKLDLTWQPNVDIRPNEVSLESQTFIRAQIESDQILLRADQKISSLQGRFEQVSVRFPAGVELIKLDDPERHSYKVDPENPQRVTVSFKEKANAAQLNWTLRLRTKLGSPVTIDGFVVEGARKQVGKIGFAITEGLRLSKSTDPTLIGINASEFPSSMGPVEQAYQFFSQPFKLVTTIEEVKPIFEVTPQMLLTASAQSMTLDAQFDVHVDRDSMNEVILSWPGIKSEGWTIEPINEPRVVESSAVDGDGQITVRLFKYRQGSFSFRLRARRHFNVGDEVNFTLPRAKSASRLTPTTVILANAENVDTDLTPRGETVFHLLPSSSIDPKELPETTRGLKTTVYRVDTDEQSFGLRVIPQKQRIRTESFTEAKWQDNQFRITQHLIYDVSYERLSQIRLLVPPSIDADRGLRFYTEDEVELTPELLQSPAGEGRQIQLKLTEALIGHFEIQARFSIPAPKDGVFDQPIRLPILTSLDEAFLQTRVSLTQTEWFDAEPMSPETWLPQLNRQEGWKWMAEGGHDEIRLKLVRSTHANETGSVSRGLIQLILDGSGEGTIRAQFRVATRALSLPVTLPESATRPVFYWDQKRLPERDCTETPVGSRRFLIHLPESRDPSAQAAHLLTIDYQDTFGTTMGWSDHLELRAPQLPNCSWFQVYWQITLPAGQHLLTYPRAAAPMFHWERVGFVYSRVPIYSSETLQQWVTKETNGPAPAPDSLLSDKNGNSYTFSQFDSPKSLIFQTLSSPMVLLLGAGFSLAVGFIMLRLVMLRNVMTLLMFGLIVAVVGLFYSEPLELLIQPMVAGLVFPAVAVFLDSWIRRRFNQGVMSFEGGGEFPPMQSFGSHFVIRQSDPNEPTLHRPANRDSASNVPVESGSGVS